ncbi:uncharacterized protein BDZ99DRAFT_518836 [Mytilinidion resinicola]|uniref:Uncharacterized protein n=1 Tax=Mytilinidion resinicola TaxID=574789 RepID=A0A6A6YRK9_9PEZI|nr:uncharacterized protein BDZ99DRAFT_518836 [Mytilinidion resinicola]KAF2811576.1 hypothetical protein BDZ99DRAFT_518836 [Mytilinidion resinicola]
MVVLRLPNARLQPPTLMLAARVPARAVRALPRVPLPAVRVQRAPSQCRGRGCTWGSAPATTPTLPRIRIDAPSYNLQKLRQERRERDEGDDGASDTGEGAGGSDADGLGSCIRAGRQPQASALLCTHARGACLHFRCLQCRARASDYEPASPCEPRFDDAAPPPPPPIPPRHPERASGRPEPAGAMVLERAETIPIMSVDDTKRAGMASMMIIVQDVDAERAMASAETLLNAPSSIAETLRNEPGRIPETLTAPIARVRVQQHRPPMLHMHRPLLIPRRFR